MSLVLYLDSIFKDMNLKGFIIVLILIAATAAAFFSGGYHMLMPFWFLAGLFCISVVDLFAALRMQTKKLLTLASTTLAVATLDEYLHVSTGTYAYFDRGVPSPLSVFGWSLLMIFILTIATRLSRLLPWKNKKGMLGILPTVVSIVLLFSFAGIQGYLPLLKWPVILLYIALWIASAFYAYMHPFGWTISLMISGMIAGATMELVGALNGMWFFHFLEPLPLFMIFTWTLRTWTVYASCSLLGADFATGDD